MQIKINGKPEEIQANTVLELLQSKEIEPQMVSVELNSTMVDRSAYSTTPLKDGDAIEFLFFMGGGENFPHGKFFPIYYLPFTSLREILVN
ncbi:MAG: sulfur carrier protein ThiS [Nitrospirae bacterium]|nr:sulfur carrier protein ThiS [Nitrospirota bacterium]